MKQNFNFLKRPYPRVKLHPATIKHMKKGHPWVTLDSFSRSFPKERIFLIGVEGKNESEFSVLLNDPDHPNVKARLWGQTPPHVEAIKNFPIELERRMEQAFKKRLSLEVASDRENFYLLFGEGDLLPGLFVQVFQNRVLIQYYASFWKRMEELVFPLLSKMLREYFPQFSKVSVWVQNRTTSTEKNFRRVSFPHIKNDRGLSSDFVMSEFGVNYRVKLDSNYDQGIYSDMSAIRKKLSPLFENSKSVLNLYAYTGAFSLFALKNGADKVTSVDLSPKYLEWLSENISLNEELDSDKNENLVMPVANAISKLKREKSRYDLIICDPPSASSDGKKITQALKNYEKLIPQMKELLTDSGKLVVFLNTHRITRKKFRSTIEEIAKKNGLKASMHLTLSDDCPRPANFPEGDYLKGIVLESTQS